MNTRQYPPAKKNLKKKTLKDAQFAVNSFIAQLTLSDPTIELKINKRV